MNEKNQDIESIGIIGSADGPTAVYMTYKKKMPVKARIEKYLYKQKRRKAQRKITAGTHTLEETAAYAEENYGAIKTERKHGESFCHVYEIRKGDDLFEMEFNYEQNDFGVSFSGNKKTMKYFRSIAKELYIYYGVSEKDISEKTERYFSLLNILTM